MTLFIDFFSVKTSNHLLDLPEFCICLFRGKNKDENESKI